MAVCRLTQGICIKCRQSLHPCTHTHTLPSGTMLACSVTVKRPNIKSKLFALLYYWKYLNFKSVEAKYPAAGYISLKPNVWATHPAAECVDKTRGYSFVPGYIQLQLWLAGSHRFCTIRPTNDWYSISYQTGTKHNLVCVFVCVCVCVCVRWCRVVNFACEHKRENCASIPAHLYPSYWIWISHTGTCLWWNVDDPYPCPYLWISCGNRNVLYKTLV